MSENKSYFFCGIGGSGMLPLAMIVAARGDAVSGSDRSRDQGRTPEKFAWLENQGIAFYPQDGSGPRAGQILVASAAIEDSVPDIAAANALGLARMTRADLNAALFNAADSAIGVGGTSGKSTVTGMIGWILESADKKPTVMNGAVMRNFAGADKPFASALVGDAAIYVSEVDESDGSIALYHPDVAVVTNISLDHKSLAELHQLFGDFAAKARVAVVNADDAEVNAAARSNECCQLWLWRCGDDPRQRFRSAARRLPFRGPCRWHHLSGKASHARPPQCRQRARRHRRHARGGHDRRTGGRGIGGLRRTRAPL